MILHLIRVARRPVAFGRAGRVVAQFGVMGVEIHCIQPESINASLQPEPHHVQQRILHIPVVEIQIRLRVEEVMQVILPALRLPRPS